MRIIPLILSLLLSAHSIANNQGFYRSPSIHGETVVFAAEGDLWKVPLQGGTAIRLTTSHGWESLPSISPDGNKIAFTGEYDGEMNIYVMPINGGQPERVTWSDGLNLVRGWTSNNDILFSENQNSTPHDFQLATVNLDSLEYSYIPLSQAFEGTFSDSGILFFTRHSGASNSIGHYQGGRAKRIWKYVDGKEATPLTHDYPGTSSSPVYWNNRVYFASDRSGTGNLWSMDLEGQNLTQHTFHKDMDVKSLALHNGQMVYQLGIDLFTLNLNLSGAEPALLEINLPSDREQRRSRWVHWPHMYLSDYDLSPDGSQLALCARGQVSIVPVKNGRTIHIPPPAPDTFFSSARFMAETPQLLAKSDQGTYQSIWLLSAEGKKESHEIVRSEKTIIEGPVVSPDNRFFVWLDADLVLWLSHIKSGETEKITQLERRYETPDDFDWSPDSQWLAFSAQAENRNRQLHLYSIIDNSLQTITDDRTNSHMPLWSPDGKWLVFLSERFYNSRVMNPFGQNQPKPFSDKNQGIFMYALNPGAIWPFEPNNEVLRKKVEHLIEEGQSEAEEGSAANPDQVPPVRIEFGNLADRLYQVPLPAADYKHLDLAEGHLLWVEEDGNGGYTLKSMVIDNDPENKPFTVASDIEGYSVSFNSTQILIHKRDQFTLVPVGVQEKALDALPVSLEHWKLQVSPPDEWSHLLTRSWTLLRDFFTDPTINGVDWPAELEKYLPLVERVSDRQDLNSLIGMMTSKLGVLHVNADGGDLRLNEQWSYEGALGADLASSEQGVRINRIYRSDPNYPHERSPLARPGTRVNKGDLITAINHQPVRSLVEVKRELTLKGDTQVLLDLKKSGSDETWQEIIWPLSPDKAAWLKHLDWRLGKREYTEKQGQGKIGYVHLSRLLAEDYSEWVRQFYPVFNRDALILDLRNNGGGYIDNWIIDSLLNKVVSYERMRGSLLGWKMPYAFQGHIVVLINQNTASDAEALASYLRDLDLATIIGTRSWGGFIWMDTNNLIDNGTISLPVYFNHNLKGKWLPENWGVEPDIQVDNLPYSSYHGQDAQLEKAVLFLQEKLEKEPVPKPEMPSYPVSPR